ncbi:replicative DNA helicase [Pilibacter termitis]|uniref:Replicative DNA helicase n=1 Tax=Pilibacter termitis TaxID=263852 RepID=A0A1T4PYA5_9ENTE|nr:replicative DNA helicase [Pilibacter termitis]SJZ96306.1 replicative DNA helicase [Pilibacter termitis]
MPEFYNRMPPNDREAERAVLGSVLLEADRFIEAREYIEPEDFYHHAHQVIFSAMERLNEKGMPIDVLTLSEELEKSNQQDDAGGLPVLYEMVESVPTAANTVFYAKSVMEKSQLRKLIQATTDAATLAFEGNDEAEEIIAQAEDLILKVTEKKNKAGFKKIRDVITESLQTIEKNAATTDVVTGLATGFIDLDKVTTGFHAGQLIILAARPAMGKTAFALNIAQNVGTKTNNTVAVFSLEMAAPDLVNRMLCAEGNVNSTNLRSGQLNDEEWEKLIVAAGALSQASIYLDDTAGIKVNEIRAKCRKLAQESGNLGLIVIDYMQLIESSSKESRQQQVSEISRQLKKLAMELKVPVIALSQLSRGVESRDDKRPELSDLRESGSIEQDADIVAFLYRDSYYRKENGEEEEEEGGLDQDITEIILKKNRAGAVKTVEVLFKGEYNRFTNLYLEPQHIEKKA